MALEYINQQLCISATGLMAVMSEGSYYKMLSRNREVVKAQRGGGQGRCAMIIVDTLPTKIKAKVRELYPNVGVMKLQEWFRENYILNAEARAIFSAFHFENGEPLKPEKINEYTINASVIIAVKRLMASASALRKAMANGRVSWDEMAEAVSFFKKEYKHTLPESAARFRKAVAKYDALGFEGVITARHGNQNSRKVDYRVERLILSLDSLPQRPLNTTVAEMYNSFVCGELDVYDPQTGELFDPEEFTDKSGEPLILSETTIANYLNNPKNRALRAKLHDTAWDFNNRHRPHHHRKSPVFAFSKISLDDRDLPRKMQDGNRVKAYYAYDVASGCVIGYSHNRSKTADLFIDCVRNMFQTIEHNGWNCPAQVEVEHHLVNEFSDGLMKAGIVFPFVRWCSPGNSQEKRAEHFNRAKKYGVEKLSQVGIGRWYAKLDANRPRVEKVYDEQNNNYKEKTYTYEQLVAEDIHAINQYNNGLHPNQKLYPGLTRWDVLCQNQNPDLQPVNNAILYRYIGEMTRTSIRRNMYCTVKGVKFQLPDPALIEKLAPNNYNVEAYFLYNNDGTISEVYLYQEHNFIASCKRRSLSGILCDIPNIGKTVAAKYYAQNNPNVAYIDCSQAKTKDQLLRQIAKEFGIPNSGSYRKVYDQLVFNVRAMNRPLVILDEAGDLYHEAYLELKALWNATENCCGWYQMGAEDLRKKIERRVDSKRVGYAEIFSRYGDNFRRVTPEIEEECKKFLLHQARMIAQANAREGQNFEQIARKSGNSGRRVRSLITKPEDN